jgi:hypothetical protein
MLRDEWKFDYAASDVARGAQARVAYHAERLAFWKARREEVMQRIRSDGIEIDEKQVLAHRNPKSRDWERGAQVMVRNDLQRDLDECLEKLQWHTGHLDQYQGWYEVLNANPDVRVSLDSDDWLYFFARYDGPADPDRGRAKP